MEGCLGPRGHGAAGTGRAAASAKSVDGLQESPILRADFSHFASPRSDTGGMEPNYDYDVAVSFAGEDRDFVYEVVRLVTDAGYKVFYDQDEQITLWGEELTEYFPRIYEEKSRYAVMFVSRHYAAKPWTRLERRSVLVRALNQPTPYLLPVRLDHTQLDGVRSTISYLDGQAQGSSGIAAAIQQKLSGVQASGGGAFNGYVPRNEHEAATLVGERPPCWEYLMFSYSLVRRIEELHDKYLDFRMAFAESGGFVETDQVTTVIRREKASMENAIRNLDNVLSRRVNESAFGLPGEPGNLDQILHMASRYASVYESFLSWADRLRGLSTPSDEGRDVLAALALYAGQPIERMREFVYEFRAMADSLYAKVAAGESLHLNLTVKLEVSPEDSAQFDRALKRFGKVLR